MKIKHYDLFAGIGGFSIALDQVFYDHDIKHIFCEWEAFPTAVLKKHWPDATYYGDIADLVADTERQRWKRKPRNAEGQCGLSSGDLQNKEQVILTGGFPCQPFSHAGRRKGTSDDRYQWPNMFRVIQNVKPDWVIAENVRGLVTWNEGLVLQTVCADLESEGYEVQPLIIPACAVGAPHRRDRVWIVANRNNAGSRTQEHGNNQDWAQSNNGRKGQPQHRINGQSGSTPNPRQQRREQGNSEGVEADTPIGTTSPVPNQRGNFPNWKRDWREIAFATCYDSVDDGLPRRMDGVTISGARYRKEALRAYGNAIVPQVAMEIFRAIRQN